MPRAPLLFGRDSTPAVLAVDLAADGRHVVVWRRAQERVVVEREAFAPFLLLADRALVAGADGLEDVQALDGGGALRWLARFASWHDAVAADGRCRARSAPSPSGTAAAHRFFADPVHQYLLWSGRTSFGGMVFGDLHRLALDLEVVTTDGFEFPSAARPGDRIVAIALADSHGYREVLRGDRMDERALIEACGAVVRERDPDVIEGHNLFRFDLPYLEARARMHGVPLAWGRDGSVVRGRPARLQVAERSIAYRRHQVSGRHVVDTWMLAQLHDVGARDLPSFGLKDVARHLGVAAPGRTYLDGGAITREFAEQPDRLMAYALDDVVETLAVGRILAPPYFVQAQVVPFDYQSTVLRGAAAKIDRLLLREYLHRRRAVPLPAASAPVSGALVTLLRQGVARPALHVDVTSLYPSVMLARGIAPASDELAVFGELLARLRDFRVEAKRRAGSSADPAEQGHHRALQQSFKILINAFYGYLAFGAGHWNDYHAADRVTSQGREIVAAIIQRLESLDAVPVEADTDGVYFVPPPGHGAADDEALLARVAAALPDGIHLELDGRYAAMLSYKLKTYALLDERGRLSLKGSAFRSRGLEPFQRTLIEEIVRLLVTGRGGDVKAVVDRWAADFAARRVPPRLFARTETLGESLEAYRARVAAGERQASAAYELALGSGREWQAGDQVSYYVAGRGTAVTVADHARLLSAWDPARPDENVEYYQAKVWEVWTRFRRFTEREGLWTPVDEADAPAQLTLF